MQQCHTYIHCIFHSLIHSTDNISIDVGVANESLVAILLVCLSRYIIYVNAINIVSVFLRPHHFLLPYHGRRTVSVLACCGSNPTLFVSFEIVQINTIIAITIVYYVVSVNIRVITTRCYLSFFTSRNVVHYNIVTRIVPYDLFTIYVNIAISAAPWQYLILFRPAKSYTCTSFAESLTT